MANVRSLVKSVENTTVAVGGTQNSALVIRMVVKY